MRLNKILIYILFIGATLSAVLSLAQEQTGPLLYNPVLNTNSYNKYKVAKKTTAALSLPFFEDFTGYLPYPDSNKWTDFEVYINNTMGASPISMGVATFDDLNAHGLPYDSFSNTARKNADSLTSRPIDIGSLTPGDNLYLSFFYQARGNGFYPQPADSLMLYFKNRYGDFTKVWSLAGPAPGALLKPFAQVMIAITDTLFFNSTFQFRFINKAALNGADAVWNVDYIRLDKGRSANDTLITNDGFTTNPGFLLNDYTSMPYAQFKVNPTSEIVANVTDSVRNNSVSSHNINYKFVIKDGTFTLAGTPTFTSIFVNAEKTTETNSPLSIAGFPAHAANTAVTYEEKFFLDSSATTGPADNDTIIRNQVFDNYLAYDDGTAEKSYFLNLFPSLPGKIAIEYHLNKPDTLRGMSIYFGRQIPFANYKPFFINVYSELAGVNGSPHDVLIRRSAPLNPAYADSVNHFWTYILDTPVLLPAGTFYAGTSQYASDGSDSIYYGLDVNRIGGNHAYYNVTGGWSPSLISGAIMMRPVIGKAVAGSSVSHINSSADTWQISPNPATDQIKFDFGGDNIESYSISDIQGHILLKGTVSTSQTVNISDLAPGMYFVMLTSSGLPIAPKRIIKL